MTMIERFGYINLRIILGIIYFGLIVPIAIIKRMFGKSSLALEFDPALDSYRIKSINATPDQLEKPF